MFRTVSIPASSEESRGVHRIFAIDCSGSMSQDLPQLKTDLKNNLSLLCSPTLNDYFSILWFQDSFGSVVEHVQVRSAQELSTVHQLIDKWLHADNGTHFHGVMSLANELCTKYPEASQIFFMTDGCDHGDREATMRSFKETTCCNISIVEYGHLTDHDFLEHLAEECQGQLLFSEEFAKLSKQLSTSFTAKVHRAFLGVQGNCFEVVDGDLRLYKADSKGLSRVPKYDDRSRDVFVYDSSEPDLLPMSYREFQAILLFCLKTRNELLTWRVLRAYGHVSFMKQFNACVSRQEYEEFMSTVLSTPESLDDIDKDFLIGNDDRMTLLELFTELRADPQTRIYPYAVEYKRTSRKIDVVTSEGSSVSFVANKDLGCRFDVMYNSTRANVSLSCKVFGHKVVNDEVTPMEYQRSFTVIRDGVKHMPELHVKVSEAMFARLKSRGVLRGDAQYSPTKFVIDLTKLPVMLRTNFKKNITLNAYATDLVKKQKIVAERKYLKKRLRDLEDASQEEDEPEYKYVRGESKDSYVTHELTWKIAQASSLPRIDERLFTKLDMGAKNSTALALFREVHDDWKAAALESPVSVKEFAKSRLDALVQPYAEVCKRLEEIKYAVLAGGRRWEDLQDVDVEASFVTSVRMFDEVFRVTVEARELVVDV